MFAKYKGGEHEKDNGIGGSGDFIGVFVSAAHAALVTGEFSGDIVVVDDQIGVLDGSGITANVSTFTRTFSYDASTLPFSTDPSNASYHGAELSITVDGVYDFFITDPSTQTTTVHDTSGSDFFDITGFDSTVTLAFPEPIQQILFDLTDATGAVFSSTSLPYKS